MNQNDAKVALDKLLELMAETAKVIKMEFNIRNYIDGLKDHKIAENNP